MTLKSELITTKYRARAPLRLGLAGGGSDLSPYSDTYGGYVLNATIDLYAQAELHPTTANKIEFVSLDLGQTLLFDSSAELPIDRRLPLHCAIYNRIVKDYLQEKPLSFRLATSADAPAGSGLGTSSTMVVCIIKVFSEWLGLGLREYELANLAYQIERIDLMLQGGKQDQYAAAFGGVNFIEFGPESRVLVNPLRVKSSVCNELESRVVLYYTGVSRASDLIISQQIKNYQSLSTGTLNSTDVLKVHAQLMKEHLLRGNLDQFAELMNESWQTKKKLTGFVSNPSLDEIYNVAIENGAVAGKLSGAGGGGVFLFVVNFDRRLHLVNALSRLDGKVMNFHLTSNPAESWQVKCIATVRKNDSTHQ